jgi:hypothetical protein
MAHPPTTEHNYEKKIEQMLQNGDIQPMSPGTAWVDIFHDSWCDLIHDRGFCNCDPEIKTISGKPSFSIN